MSGIRRRVKGLCRRLGWSLVRIGARLVGLRLPVALIELRRTATPIRESWPMTAIGAARYPSMN